MLRCEKEEKFKDLQLRVFQKSKVAVSELAGSVEQNLRSLLDKNYKLINKKKSLKHFIESTQPLLESLKPLRNHEEKHIVQMLKEFFKDNNDALDMINEAFVDGSSLYTIRGSTASKFKPSQLLAEIEADDDAGPNISKQRSPTLSSADDILDKVGIRKRKLFTAPLDDNSDNESASHPKPPTLPTGSNENEKVAFIVGSSLYTMSIQMLVAKAVLQDPDGYARILPNNVNGAKNFKQNPTDKGTKPFLTVTIISDSRGSTPLKDPTLLSNLIHNVNTNACSQGCITGSRRIRTDSAQQCQRRNKFQAKSYRQRHETIPNRDYYIGQSGIEPTEGPNTSKQRWPTILSHDNILDKVGIGKRKLFTAPLGENSDNESASQPKPPTLPTGSNENEEAVIPRDKGSEKKHKKSKH
ncbi:Hypothetical predicted protein [Paramuricea clavata]|uniref:Uncharacterized protein n=1 Tax=Paramuricea clavata TaxID=317549 RepID=A0A7D9E1Q9_PARCT|nr:Hypothetical predicted protein [Paramuricea clavata]